MPRLSSDQDDERIAGLCARCKNARSIRSSRGSIFILCELSRSDPTFAKYPRLPVFSCSGFEPSPAPPPTQHNPPDRP